MNTNEDKKNSISYKVGQVCGSIVVAALAICIAAILVALTASFIFWLL